MKMREPILEMKSINKSFPGVHALKDVDFDLMEGEVHAIVGENGAGKSTLINILGGVFHEYTGIIKVNGESIRINNPRKSQQLGITSISQEFNLIRNLTISENIFLGCEPLNSKKLGIINRNQMNIISKSLLKVFGLNINPNTMVSQLTIVECQIVEIIKTLNKETKILIMDEPTAVLTFKETEVLYGTIEKLKNQNVSIILISHRFEDIVRVSDRVTVLRDGEKVFCGDTKSVSLNKIIQLMLGKEKIEIKKFEVNEKVKKLFVVKNLNSKKLKNISFDLYEGEMVGVVGKPGAGKHELLRTLCGIKKYDSGTFYIKNELVSLNNPSEAINSGIGFLSDDRKRDGLFPYLPITENILMPYLKSFSNKGFISAKKILNATDSKVKELNIKVNHLSQPVIYLSGGNQQKVILARWLCNDKAGIFLFEEPTRGIDIGSKFEIYQYINNLKKRKCGCIIVSSEIDEILLLCDRLLVLENGCLSDTLESSNINKSALFQLIMGQSNEKGEFSLN